MRREHQALDTAGVKRGSLGVPAHTMGMDETHTMGMDETAEPKPALLPLPWVDGKRF